MEPPKTSTTEHDFFKFDRIYIQFPKDITNREIEFLRMMLVAYMMANKNLDQKTEEKAPSHGTYA